MIWVESAAVLLGVGYLLLAILERRSCWIAGGLASLLFLGIFWRASLPQQALLQLYYMGVAAHGFRHWAASDGSPLPITRWRARYHLAAACAVAVAVLGSLLLRDALGDQRAWLDAATSWGSVLATWMMAQKRLEAWLYWILIDAVSVLMYLDAGLEPTAGLYLLYTILAVVGWLKWRSTSLHPSAA
ncbi:MAG: nicotinamide mononucleotide transporter [Halieaceae bacterium]|jgi:nicotinamide mononucleotide transporter